MEKDMFKTRQITVAVIATAFLLSLSTGTTYAAKKNVRETMTAEQKKAARKRGMEWCRNKFQRDGYTQIEKVMIREDGGITCYIRR